jgi:hypothetical protein
MRAILARAVCAAVCAPPGQSACEAAGIRRLRVFRQRYAVRVVCADFALPSRTSVIRAACFARYV